MFFTGYTRSVQVDNMNQNIETSFNRSLQVEKLFYIYIYLEAVTFFTSFTRKVQADNLRVFHKLHQVDQMSLNCILYWLHLTALSHHLPLPQQQLLQSVKLNKTKQELPNE